jgi:hypothetical protein
MNAPIVFGLFALYVAAISLFQVLAGRHDPVLSLLRRCWGRSRGHCLFFLVNVALPIMLCVLCLAWGARHYDAALASGDFNQTLHLHLDAYRDFLQMLHTERVADSIGVIYGA